MKKLFSLFAIATALIATSCSQDETVAPAGGNEVAVTFSAELPQGIATRADGNKYSDGKTATSLVAHFYEKDSKTLLFTKTATVTDLKATVTATLVNGMWYDILFWACSPANNTYSVSTSDQTLTINYTNMKANDENNDAFYNFYELHVQGAETKDVTLTRPFAQVNLGTNDFEAAKTAGMDVAKSEMVATLPNTLNFSTGEVSGDAEVTFVRNSIPTTADHNGFPIAGYEYLEMNYVLVSNVPTANATLVDFTFKACDANGDNSYKNIEVSNVPVKRNYRTNIYGSLLTVPDTFTVTINPVYTNPDNDVPADVAALENAAANGGSVALMDNVTLDEGLVVAEGKTMNLDLNGKELNAPSKVAGASMLSTRAEEVTDVVAILVKGELVINGNGKVYGGSGYNSNIAIRVEEGGKVTINGGTYSTGADKDGLGNSTIYCNGGEVVINGGHYSSDAAYNGKYYVLNLKNSAPNGVISVYGGTFENYNPADGDDVVEGTFVAEGYESYTEDEGKTYQIRLKKEGATATVMTAEALKKALTSFTTGGAGSNTVEIQEDIVLSPEEDWDPVYFSAYGASGTVTINGNGHSISGLKAALFEGTFGGNNTAIIINDLTIKDSTMPLDKQSSNEGNGVFLGYADSSGSVTMNNCHAINCKVYAKEINTGSGGFAGMVGYSSAGNIIITDCTVTDCYFEGNSVGGILAMGNGATVSDCVVTNCTFNNLESKKHKTGYIVSTINSGTNVYTNVSGSGNTYTLNGANGGELTQAFGRAYPTNPGCSIVFNDETLTVDVENK